VEIRAAGAGDLDALVPLFQEMQRHYGESPLGTDEARSRLRAALVGRRKARLLLAIEAGRALGFLTWNTSFPSPGLGSRLVIEDIYVAEAARNHGLGLRLLRRAAALAEEIGAAELAWTADPRNRAAQRFYDRLGARRVEKVVYRIDAAALRPARANPRGS
jgi:ribosomal protein S18 acetylase RimI-like enzyme